MTREREPGRGKTKSGNGTSDQVYCSFCGRSAQEVNSMIAGPKAFICDRCIKTSFDILRKEVNVVPPAATGSGAAISAPPCKPESNHGFAWPVCGWSGECKKVTVRCGL